MLFAQNDRAPLHSVTAVRNWSLADVTRIAIEVSGDFNFRTDRLHNPERVYFDILNARPRIDAKRVWSQRDQRQAGAARARGRDHPGHHARGARSGRSGGSHHLAAFQSQPPDHRTARRARAGDSDRAPMPPAVKPPPVIRAEIPRPIEPRRQAGGRRRRRGASQAGTPRPRRPKRSRCPSNSARRRRRKPNRRRRRRRSDADSGASRSRRPPEPAAEPRAIQTPTRRVARAELRASRCRPPAIARRVQQGGQAHLHRRQFADPRAGAQGGARRDRSRPRRPRPGHAGSARSAGKGTGAGRRAAPRQAGRRAHERRGDLHALRRYLHPAGGPHGDRQREEGRPVPLHPRQLVAASRGSPASRRFT